MAKRSGSDNPRTGVTELIYTKLEPPRLRADHVRRERLTRLLSEEPGSIVVASAPAGAGKTTALVDWIHASNRPAIWYSLDHHDDDPMVFFTYLAAALEPHTAPGRLSGLMTAPTERSLNTRILAGALAEDLNAAPESMILVLEDLHAITNSTIQAVLQTTVQHIPLGMTLAITTRADPPLPLAKLRAQRRLTELRAADLAFSREESRELLRSITGIDISLETVDRLNERIEGWAVGLQLAGLSIADRPDTIEFIDSFSGDDRYIADYLFDEVLNLQTEEVQSFMLETSVLSRMNAGLCAAITGNPAAGEILTDLYRRNVFLIPLDDRGWWFRYHHLFADLLRARLDHLLPGRAQALYEAASRWCETEDEIDDALRYSIDGGDVARAEHLMERHAELLLPQGQVARLVSWLRLFPQSAVEANPELLLTRAWTNLFAARPAEALADVDAVERFGPDSLRFDVRGQLEIMRAMAAWELGDVTGCIQKARNGLDLLPPSNRMLPSLGHLYLGRGELAAGRIQDAGDNLTRCTDLAMEAGNFFAGIAGFLALAAAHIQGGDLEAGAARFRAALELATVASADGRDFPAEGAAYVGLGVVAFERYDLQSAISNFRRGLFDLRRTIYLDYTVLGYRRWSESESMLGNGRAASEVLQEARTHLSQYGRVGSTVARSLDDCEVRNLLREGEIDAAESVFQAISVDRFHRPGEFAHPKFDHVATGLRIDLARGRSSEAVDRLEHLRSLINGNIGLLVKAGALEGAVWQAAGRRSAAATALREALHRASPGNWVRPFIDAGPTIAELLVEADVLDAAPDLVGRIIEATPRTVTRDLIEQPLIDPLTPRELEVLDEMAAGRTNAEIGGKLFISVGTVKRHVANIFLKLGATHRTEAVAKARSLGMFG